MFLPIGLEIDLILNRLRNKLALLKLQSEDSQRSEQRADQEQDRTGEESKEAPCPDVQWRI